MKSIKRKEYIGFLRIFSSKKLVRKMKRTVRSPANYSKVSKSIINVCSTFICRVSGKWILSS